MRLVAVEPVRARLRDERLDGLVVVDVDRVRRDVLRAAAAVVPSASAALPARPLAVSILRGPYRALVVDDDAAVRLVARRLPNMA